MERSFPRTTLWLCAGLLIWAANFLFTYVFAAIACARGFAANTLGGVGVIAVATIVSSLVAIAANAWVLRTALSRYRSRDSASAANSSEGFMDFMAGAIATLSMVAIAWTGFTAAVGQTCR